MLYFPLFLFEEFPSLLFFLPLSLSPLTVMDSLHSPSVGLMMSSAAHFICPLSSSRLCNIPVVVFYLCVCLCVCVCVLPCYSRPGCVPECEPQLNLSLLFLFTRVARVSDGSPLFSRATSPGALVGQLLFSFHTHTHTHTHTHAHMHTHTDRHAAFKYVSAQGTGF